MKGKKFLSKHYEGRIEMNNIKRKAGISLVALIITIIVLIILTAAVIITGINTPENNEYAVKMHNKATLQDAVTLYVMTEMLNNIDNFVVTSTGATKARDVADVVKDLYENGTWKEGANIKLGVNMSLNELNTVFELDDQAVVTFAEGQEPTLDGTQSGNNENVTYSWANKSAVFVGDSITAGVGTTKTYWQMLDEQLPLSTVTGMGIGGSCISITSDRGTSITPLINRYQTIPNADLISVFMGTNDYGHKTPLGTIADTTDISFYGALNVIIPGIKEAHPNSTIVFMTPIHRYHDADKNAVGANLADYVEAIKDVCEANNVPVIDLYTLFDVKTGPSMPDGVHPTVAGHEIMANLITEELKKIAPPTN